MFSEKQYLTIIKENVGTNKILRYASLLSYFKVDFAENSNCDLV